MNSERPQRLVIPTRNPLAETVLTLRKNQMLLLHMMTLGERRKRKNVLVSTAISIHVHSLISIVIIIMHTLVMKFRTDSFQDFYSCFVVLRLCFVFLDLPALSYFRR